MVILVHSISLAGCAPSGPACRESQDLLERLA